jgi:hypothetical protein
LVGAGRGGALAGSPNRGNSAASVNTVIAVMPSRAIVRTTMAYGSPCQYAAAAGCPLAVVGIRRQAPGWCSERPMNSRQVRLPLNHVFDFVPSSVASSRRTRSREWMSACSKAVT